MFGMCCDETKHSDCSVTGPLSLEALKCTYM